MPPLVWAGQHSAGLASVALHLAPPSSSAAVTAATASAPTANHRRHKHWPYPSSMQTACGSPFLSTLLPKPLRTAPLQPTTRQASRASHTRSNAQCIQTIITSHPFPTTPASLPLLPPLPQNIPAFQLLGDRVRRQCGCSSIFGDDASAAAAAAAAAAAHSDDAPPAVGRAAQFNPLRRAALRPGGPVSRRFFARHPTVLQVGGAEGAARLQGSSGSWQQVILL